MFPSDDILEQTNLLVKCELCGKQFMFAHDLGLRLQPSDRPADASPSPLFSSSSQLLGTRISCPGNHAYCGDCLCQHIQKELDGTKLGLSPFPIMCPVCPKNSGTVSDDDAVRILPSDMVEEWVSCIGGFHPMKPKHSHTHQQTMIPILQCNLRFRDGRFVVRILRS